jgi:hypothetical protein
LHIHQPDVVVNEFALINTPILEKVENGPCTRRRTRKDSPSQIVLAFLHLLMRSFPVVALQSGAGCAGCSHLLEELSRVLIRHQRLGQFTTSLSPKF